MPPLSAVFSRFASRSLLHLSVAGALLSPLCAAAQSSAASLEAALRSEVALVFDLDGQSVLYEKNSQDLRPIASISKLMTALVIAESGLPMDEVLSISDEDVDRMRHSRSRLA